MDPLTRFRSRLARGIAVSAALFDGVFLLTLLLADFGVPAYTELLIGATLGHVAVALLPWPRLVETGHDRPVLTVYMAANVALSLTAVATSTTEDTEAFFFVLFSLGVASLLVRLSDLVVLTLMGLVGYLVAAGMGPGQTVGTTATRFVALIGVLTLVRLVMRGWSNALRTAEQARRDGERHRQLLEIVAASASNVSDVETNEVLARVVRTLEQLGFDLSAIWLLRDGRFRLLASSEEVVGEDDLEPEDGIAGQALATSSTVVIEDYATDAIATESGRALQLRGVVATPIRARGEVVGILAAGMHRPWDEADHPLVNATELLAANAGRALELAEAMEEEQRTVAELLRLDTLKDDFISTVSHEMRTPLAVMLGSVETVLARWDGLGDDLRRDLLERAARSGHALNGVIQTLLDFRKLEQGSFAFRPSETRVDHLVASVVDRLSDVLSGHRVELDLAPAEIAADPHLLERVLENLLVNAARHTPAGTAVTVRAAGDATSGVCVSVEDDGPGIAAGEVERLGERFFRGGDPNTRDTRGVGLGLALVTELLELHGSELTIASELGTGTRFGFHLPGAPAEDRPLTSVAV